MFLSAIAYQHGDARPLGQLGEAMPVDLTLPIHGLANYRVSGQEIWQIAAAVAQATHDLAGGEADLILYATENDRSATDSLARIARELGRPRIEYLAISGHACGNLGVALALARDAIQSGRHSRILLIMADRALANSRVMTTGLSVFSDGGAACMLTAEPARSDQPQFAVGEVVTCISADADPADLPGFMASTVELGRLGIEGVLAATGMERADFRRIMFANYRLSSQRFLAAVMGFPEAAILAGPIAEFGHSFSADLLVNLQRSAESGDIQRGDRLLMSATGPYTWSMVDVARV